jgi:hypothetical protein
MNSPSARAQRVGAVARTIGAAVIVIAVCVLAWLNVGGGLADEIWEDEAFTLMTYANEGFFRPFTIYLNPNNHPLFSGLLAVWRGALGGTTDVEALRWLPLAAFLCSLPLVFGAAYRLAGLSAAIVAVTIFAVGTVTANHATQLRGYALSWPLFGLAFLASFKFGDMRRLSRWHLAYIAASALAVATLPSNLFLLAALAIGVAIYLGLVTPLGWRLELCRIALLVAAPAVGMLAFVGIADQLRAAALYDYSGYNRNLIFGQWVVSTLSDIAWFLPALMAGAGLMIVRARDQSREVEAQRARASLLLVLLFCGGVVAMIYALPNPPFPRTLVPMLPVWCCLLGMFAAHTIDAARTRHASLQAIVWFWFVAAILIGFRAQPCGGIPSNKTGEEPIDLCYQYYRNDFSPAKVVSAVTALQMKSRSGPRPVIGLHQSLPLRYVHPDGFEPMHYAKAFAPIRFALGDRFVEADWPLVIANGEVQLLRQLDYLKLPRDRYQLAADTGYFKLYAPRFTQLPSRTP